jgi:hypothetical protein
LIAEGLFIAKININHANKEEIGLGIILAN